MLFPLLSGSYTLETLATGGHTICIKVVKTPTCPLARSNASRLTCSRGGVNQQNLAYALTQVIHNFGAAAVVGGALAALCMKPLQT